MNLYLILFTCVVFRNAFGQIIDYYPPSWNEICEVVKNETDEGTNFNFICFSRGDEDARIDFKELDDYSRRTTENISYTVEVSCTSSGNISMIWPIKVSRLTKVKVTGCIILDYINDWANNTLDYTEDNLQSLQIIDSKTMIDLSVLFRSLTYVQNISREWTCGHDETIRTRISRNMSMGFMTSDPTVLQNLRPDSDPLKMIKSFLDKNAECVFSHLETIEDTYAGSMSKYHMNVMSKFSKFPVLKYINFSHNHWEEINEVFQDWRTRFSEMKYLDLSYNRITKVDLKNRLTLPPGEDTIIDVSYNNITTLTTQDVTDWAKLSNMFVDIRGNPLDCGCFKQDLIFNLQDESFFVGNIAKYKYLRNMTCASPESARGIKISDVTKVSMGCEIPPEDLTIYLIVLGVMAVIFIVMIIVIFRYRREIKIILYIRFHILLPWDVDDKKEDKTYDAFVSYSSKDDTWVLDYLQQKLEMPENEDTPSFNLCLHQRDFIGGTSILENIIDSIENSRHTIVILSKNFLKSVWGMEEFRHAYYQSIVKKHRHLIIIKYEDVPENIMDPTLKRCLKTFTYLDVKDTMFLDRLRFALAIKTRQTKCKTKCEKTSPDLTLSGPLGISSSPSVIHSQVSNCSDDSGYVDYSSSHNGHINPSLKMESEVNASRV